MVGFENLSLTASSRGPLGLDGRFCPTSAGVIDMAAKSGDAYLDLRLGLGLVGDIVNALARAGRIVQLCAGLALRVRRLAAFARRRHLLSARLVRLVCVSAALVSLTGVRLGLVRRAAPYRVEEEV